MPPFRFAVWNLLASLGWTVSVAASAYGISRLATGHQEWRDIAVLVIGLSIGALFAVVAMRRHRRLRAGGPGAVAREAPGDSSC
jgi:membrane protein DedA with SNARE-associated domain